MPSSPMKSLGATNPGHASYLSAEKYGYDMVVATTQAALNSTMLSYMSNCPASPTTAIYRQVDRKGTVEVMTFEEFSKICQVDPFAVDTSSPGFDAATNKECLALKDARFLYGFTLTPGIPPGYAPGALPDVLTLNTNAGSVGYTMLCSDIRTAQYTPANVDTDPQYVVGKQQDGDAWICKASVDLRMSKLDDNAFSTLPAEVQDGIKNMGKDAFSVQQLMFDLAQVGLMGVPNFPEIVHGSEAHEKFCTKFCVTYFKHMKDKGQPVLNVAIISHTPDLSAFRPTDLNIQVCQLIKDASAGSASTPSKGDQQLTTLNYVCSSFGNPLTPLVQFDWNSIEPAQATLYDGVIYLNRNTFLSWVLRTGLMKQAKLSCISCNPSACRSGVNVKFELNPTAGQTPTSMPFVDGQIQQLLSFHEDRKDSCGELGKDWGNINSVSDYTCAVSLQGNVFTIIQHLNLYLYVSRMETHWRGNIINKTVTDSYTFKVDESGKMITSMKSATEDKPERPDINFFTNIFTDLNGIIGDLVKTADAVATKFTDFPLSDLQGFMFPGGKTFAFSHFNFSDHGDLTAAINYVEPTSVVEPHFPQPGLVYPAHLLPTISGPGMMGLPLQKKVRQEGIVLA